MKLLFKQRMFSWFDSYDIYNEAGDAVYEVKGVLSWGHCLKIFGPDGAELGTVKEEVFSFLPRFALYVGGECVGQIKKEFTFFKPVFTLDCSGWSIEGDLWEWNYLVSDADGRTVMTVQKELLNWTDTYVLDIADSADALYCLMVVLAPNARRTVDRVHTKIKNVFAGPDCGVRLWCRFLSIKRATKERSLWGW